MKKLTYYNLILLLLFVSGCDIEDDGSYDIKAQSLSTVPKEISVGDRVTFHYSVKNVGKDTIRAGSYNVDLFLNDTSIAFDHDTSLLLPGEEVEYSMVEGAHHWVPKTAGVYTYKLIVDGKDNLKETDELNNLLKGSIIVR